jgi:hypothetical protein
MIPGGEMVPSAKRYRSGNYSWNAAGEIGGCFTAQNSIFRFSFDGNSGYPVHIVPLCREGEKG